MSSILERQILSSTPEDSPIVHIMVNTFLTKNDVRTVFAVVERILLTREEGLGLIGKEDMVVVRTLISLMGGAG